MLPEDAWTKIDVRDGEKGPLVIEAVKCHVQTRTDTGGTGPDEILFVTRERQADNTYKHDYYLSNAAADVPLAEFARVAKAAHRIEECFERAKGEAGLADYQVRNWIRLASSPNPVAAGRVVPEQGDAAGKKKDPGSDVSATTTVDRRADRRLLARRNCPLPFVAAVPAGCSATSKQGFTFIVRVTYCRL